MVKICNLVGFILKGVDPWLSQTSSASAVVPPDPWAPATVAQPLSKPNQEFDEFSLLGNRSLPTSMYKKQWHNWNITFFYFWECICVCLEATPDPFDLSHINNELLGTSSQSSTSGKKTPHSFLGENSALVNLDNLVTAPITPAPVTQTRPPGKYF